jgi:tryptophan synthase alpha chain
MDLRSPLMVGFGIETGEHFQEVTKFAAGAIVGSAYLRAIEKAPYVQQATTEFVGKFI